MSSISVTCIHQSTGAEWEFDENGLTAPIVGQIKGGTLVPKTSKDRKALDSFLSGEDAGDAPDSGDDAGDAPDSGDDAGDAPDSGDDAGDAPDSGDDAGDAPDNSEDAPPKRAAKNTKGKS